MQPPGNTGVTYWTERVQSGENRKRRRSPQQEGGGRGRDTTAGYSEMEMRARSVLFAFRDTEDEETDGDV